MEDLEASKRQSNGDGAIEDESGSGWIACTTDSILAMKDTLWDMLITMPPDFSVNAKEKVWPIVECPRGKPIKATQRDLRRFNALRSGLAHLAANTPVTTPGVGPESPGSDGSGMRMAWNKSRRTAKHEDGDVGDKLVEPLSWTALAYNGFMWWASAGEQLRSEEQEEAARDASLLADLVTATSNNGSSMSMSLQSPSPRADLLSESVLSFADRRSTDEGEARIELAIIAYFHRLTTQMLSILVDIVDASDEAYPNDSLEDDSPSDEDEGLPRIRTNDSDTGSVLVDSRSIEDMGLDVWSASDGVFVQELLATYFGRRGQIEGKGVEVCGVRVC